MLISLRGLEKSYPQGGGCVYVLRRINADIAEDEFVSIVGPSGAGKSTHSETNAAYGSRIIKLRDGWIVEPEPASAGPLTVAERL